MSGLVWELIFLSLSKLTKKFWYYLLYSKMPSKLFSGNLNSSEWHDGAWSHGSITRHTCIFQRSLSLVFASEKVYVLEALL